MTVADAPVPGQGREEAYRYFPTYTHLPVVSAYRLQSFRCKGS
jgi:hypothetical protein